MIIVCDVDCVLNDLVSKTVQLYNARSGRNITVDDITTYQFSECLNQEDADGINALFDEKELWDSLSPLAGSQDGLKRLMKRGNQVYLATATNPKNFAWKVDWLSKYFPFIPSDNVIRIMHKGLLKADVLIDDCIDNLKDSYAERVCLDAPWNRDENKDFVYSIRRAYNWSDIVNIVNDIEKEIEPWLK
jgi:5'(3')-deoxyribonucleotidase